MDVISATNARRLIGSLGKKKGAKGARGSVDCDRNAALLQVIIPSFPHSFIFQPNSLFIPFILGLSKMPIHFPTKFDGEYWTTSKWLRVACIAASSPSPLYLVIVGASWGFFLLVVNDLFSSWGEFLSS